MDLLEELKVAINERLVAIGDTALGDIQLPPLAGNLRSSYVSTWIKTIRGKIPDILETYTVVPGSGEIVEDNGFVQSDYSYFGTGLLSNVAAAVAEVLSLAGYPSGWIDLGSTLLEDPSPIIQLQDVFGVLLRYSQYTPASITTALGAKTQYGQENYATSWAATSDAAWDELVAAPNAGNGGAGDPWQSGLHLAKHSPHWIISQVESAFIHRSTAQECYESVFSIPAPSPTPPGSLVKRQLGFLYFGSPEFTSTFDVDFDGNTITVNPDDDASINPDWYDTTATPGSITMTVSSSLPSSIPFSVPEEPSGAGSWQASVAASLNSGRYYYLLSVGGGLTYG